jgi:hypothetical protein
MARIGPIFHFWSQDSHFTVHSFHTFIISVFNQLFDSVLMQWAEGGSLDDYIDARLGRPTHLPHPTSHHASTDDDDDLSSEVHSRSARIRAFRAMQRAAPSEKSALRAKLSNTGHSWTAVHLLSAEEVLGIFGGVAAGLGFLVRLSYFFSMSLQRIDRLGFSTTRASSTLI